MSRPEKAAATGSKTVEAMFVPIASDEVRARIKPLLSLLPILQSPNTSSLNARH